jgi:hypothetical protein
MDHYLNEIKARDKEFEENYKNHQE